MAGKYESTRQSLLALLGGPQDELAWDVFYSYYHGFITALLLRRHLPSAEIEDVRQEVCVNCWKALQNGHYDRSKGRFRSWLATVCSNTATSHLRRSGQGSALPSDVSDGTVAPDELWIEEEWKLHMMNLAWDEAQLHFTPKVLAVYQKLLNGEDAGSVAAAEGLAVNTVYVYRNRVEDALASYIRQLDAHL